MRGMRGLTPVLAVVIMVMMAIALTGSFWMYLLNYTETSMEGHIQLVDALCVDSDQAMVTIRNVGTDIINVDEIQVIDKLTGDDITRKIGWSDGEVEPGKLLWLKFDEGSGGYTYDSSRYERTVSLANSPGFTSEAVYGNSIMFDGATEYAQVENFPGLMEGSVTFWLNWANSTGHGVTHGSLWAIGSLSWIVFVDGPNENITMRLFNPSTGTPACNAQSPGFTSPPNKWIHVVGAWNTTGCMVYVNGELMRYAENSTTYHVGDFNLTIGSSPQPLHVGGMYDDFRVYDRILHPDQIRALADKNAHIMRPGGRKTMMHTCTTGRCEYRLLMGMGISTATVSC